MSFIWQRTTGGGHQEEAGKSWNSTQAVVHIGTADVKHCKWFLQVMGE